MKALLISTYDMGRQPFALASASAWLKSAGWDVRPVDLAKDRLEERHAATADLIALHLPMHTATRLASPVIQKLRAVNPTAAICAYGLYAPLNREWLQSMGVQHVFGGEFEEDLAALAARTMADAGRGGTMPRETVRPGGEAMPAPSPAARLPRLTFRVPDRSGLPPLSRYAALQMPDGSRRLVGYTEATRGCKHLCRHCPIVPIYAGQFRIVQTDIVAADIDAQVAAGAQHITFGDPDFLNGPAHAVRVVERLHARHPRVTYDVTIKIEHLLKHRELLARLVATGCAFVTSAVESVDDRVLLILDKGHTRQDFVEAVSRCRAAGLIIVPTFVAFHPWLTLDGYCELLETIAALDLIDHVAPIQLAIRLLVPQGSRLLAVGAMQPHLGGFDPGTLTYRWSHPDPRVDQLQRDVAALVGARIAVDRREIFAAVAALAHERAGRPAPATRPARHRATVPYLNEPWYC